MFNKNRFKYYCAEKGVSLGEVSNELGINPASLTRKINGQTDFTRNEIIIIRNFLELTVEEVEDVFFTQ